MRQNKKLLVSEGQSIYSDDDGYYTPEVGSWAESKYRLVQLYNNLFATGMKKIWHKRVYIDLFSGAGKAKIKKANKFLSASPLLALKIPNQYDRYIFCDDDERNIDALQNRVKREFPLVDAHFICGDCNKKVGEIVELIPQASPNNKVLSFCFVDPFSLNIEFATIRTLSTHFVDFLILLALSMDGNRNESIYAEENNQKIDKFLGLTYWRDHWEVARRKDQSFRRFLAKEYANQMTTLRYKQDSLQTTIEMRSDEKNLPLYHLAFFSRHKRGYEFWKEVRKYATSQQSLFEIQ